LPTREAYTRVLVELQQLEREVIEQAYLRRVDGLERVGEAVRRLGEVGSPAGLLACAAEELGASSAFDRVIVSRVEDERLRPLATWASPDVPEGQGETADLASGSFALRYPLIEADVAQRHGGALVKVAEGGPRALPAFAEALGWQAYVVAAIALDRTTVGLLHADRIDGPPLDDLDLDLATRYADGFGHAFERALLREKLGRQRRRLQAAAQWINGRMLDLSAEETPSDGGEGAADRAELSELLTPRELEVLRLITRGLSNRAIAGSLMLREGTVKYHVKNILRKLGSRSRAEAVSRFMQLYAGPDDR
jgi:DNA-binding CsgD family transcriptional regulator